MWIERRASEGRNTQSVPKMGDAGKGFQAKERTTGGKDNVAAAG